jgi:hypothetical protein
LLQYIVSLGKHYYWFPNCIFSLLSLSKQKAYIPVAQTASLTNFMFLIAYLGSENLYSGGKLGVTPTNSRTCRMLK